MLLNHTQIMFYRTKILNQANLMRTISNTFLILKHKLQIMDINLRMQVAIHIEPIGVYSKKYKSLEELPDGADNSN